MAKKKRAKTKTKAKATKARRKKLSVKKRPVKDLDAGKAQSTKGGALAPAADRALKLPSAAVKFGGLPAAGDTFQKIF
jgi:hypothetical protein